MDTDELSKETYRAIIIEAEKFDHDLTLQFRLLSGDCKDEQEFIFKSRQLIDELKMAKRFGGYFFGNLPNFAKTKQITRLSSNRSYLPFRITKLSSVEKIKKCMNN